jgi:hypothetical protein
MQLKPNSADRIREAVSRGAYGELDRLLDVYRHEVEVNWQAATSAEERHMIATEVTAVLAWARASILAARSHAQSKLIHLTRHGAYAASAARRATQLDLDA